METFTETTLQELKSDVDILIPLYIDHKDRYINLLFILRFLEKLGFDNVYIKQYNTKESEWDFVDIPSNLKYKEISYGIISDDNFNKMKCVNELTNNTKSNYLAIWDVDVIFPRKNLEEVLISLMGGADMVYPYDGNFYNVPKDKFENLENGKIDLNDCELWNPNSFGGAVFFNRKSFIEGGKCNPNFKNVGFDDNEIQMRFHRLGYKIQRVPGPLLHLDHYRSETSVEKSPYLNHNMAIYNYVASCPIEELREEIKTW